MSTHPFVDHLADLRAEFVVECAGELSQIANMIQRLVAGTEQVVVRGLASRVQELAGVLLSTTDENETTDEIGPRLHGLATWDWLKADIAKGKP